MFAFAKDEYDAVTAFFEAVKMMKGVKNAEIVIEMDTRKDQSADYFRPGEKFVPSDSNTNGIHEGHFKKKAALIKEYETLGNAIPDPDLRKYYRDLAMCWRLDYKDISRIFDVRVKTNFILSELFTLRELYGDNPAIVEEIDKLIKEFQRIMARRNDYAYDCVMDGYEELFKSIWDDGSEKKKTDEISMADVGRKYFYDALHDHGYEPEAVANAFKAIKDLDIKKDKPLFYVDGFNDETALTYTKSNGIYTMDIERDTLTAGFSFDNFNTFVKTWFDKDTLDSLHKEGRDCFDCLFVDGQSLRERYNQEFASDYRESCSEISIRFLSDVLNGQTIHMIKDGKFVEVDVEVNKDNLPKTYAEYLNAKEKARRTNQFLSYTDEEKENLLKASLEKTKNREMREKNIIFAGALFFDYSGNAKYMPLPQKNGAKVAMGAYMPSIFSKAKKVHDSHEYNILGLEEREDIAKLAKAIITNASYYEAHKNTTADKYPMGKEMGFKNNRELVYIDGVPAREYLRKKYSEAELTERYEEIFDTELVYLLSSEKHTIDVLCVGKNEFGKTSAKFVEMLPDTVAKEDLAKREERHNKMLAPFDLEKLAKNAGRKERMIALLSNAEFKKALTGLVAVNVLTDAPEYFEKSNELINKFNSCGLDGYNPDYEKLSGIFKEVLTDLKQKDPASLGPVGKEACKKVFCAIQAAGFYDKHSVNPLVNELRMIDDDEFSYSAMFKLSKGFAKYVPEAKGLGETKSDIDRAKDKLFSSSAKELYEYAKQMETVKKAKRQLFSNTAEFEKMYEAVSRLSVYALINDFPRNVDDKDNFKKAMKKAKTACTSYVIKKGDGKKATPEQQLRYDLAKGIISSIDDFENEKTNRFDIKVKAVSREKVFSEATVDSKSLTKKTPAFLKDRKKEKEIPELNAPTAERISFKELKKKQ